VLPNGNAVLTVTVPKMLTLTPLLVVTTRIISGYCRAVMAGVVAESVHCCVTSPPYYGLRDYGIAGQLGLESSPAEYVAVMVEVFREVRRVLRADATCWVNLGDGYANKQLLGMPWLLAFALRDDGWYLRSEITWGKKAPMPESVTDRPTQATEKVFLLSKSARYFYDAEAVMEQRTEFAIEHEKKYSSLPRKTRQENANRKDGGDSVFQAGFANLNGGRNMRNFWLLGPEPFPEAHFATFPSEIPRRAILAGTSERGVCPKCGAPWERVVEKSGATRKGNTASGWRESGARSDNSAVDRLGEVWVETLGWLPTCACMPPAVETPGVAAGGRYMPVPATVLDPFLGAGTTGLVADQLQRHCIGIELNPAYAAMAERRIYDDAPLFAHVRLDSRFEQARISANGLGPVRPSNVIDLEEMQLSKPNTTIDLES
jgi:DNA modification methylase